jgi:hypothetical protein
VVAINHNVFSLTVVQNTLVGRKLLHQEPLKSQHTMLCHGLPHDCFATSSDLTKVTISGDSTSVDQQGVVNHVLLEKHLVGMTRGDSMLTVIS